MQRRTKCSRSADELRRGLYNGSYSNPGFPVPFYSAGPCIAM